MSDAQDAAYKSAGNAATGHYPAGALDMAVARIGSVTVVVWALVASLVTAQITFSRDWTGGKRAPAPLDCAQFTRLCRQFVHELRESMAPSPGFTKHRRPDEDPAYDDEK